MRNSVLLPRSILALLTIFAFRSQAAEEPKATLLLWARADDLKLKDGERIERWTERSGFARTLTAQAANAPTFVASGEGGFPAAGFKFDAKAKVKAPQFLNAQFDGDERRGMSLLVVGTGLKSSGWFDSAPGNSGCIRLFGPLQHCGSKSGNSQAFTKIPPAGLHLVEIVAGMQPDGSMRLATYCDGVLIEDNTDKEPKRGVVLDRMQLGAYAQALGLNGTICEALIYDNALSDADRKAAEQYLMKKFKLGSANGPETPPGIRVVAKAKHTDLRPDAQGLKLWLKADDIVAESGEEVATWPNAAGDKKPALAPEGHRPELVRDSLTGVAAVSFQNGGRALKDKEAAPPIQWFDTTLSGSFPALTVFMVGKRLNHPGVFDAKPSDFKTSLYHDGTVRYGISKTCLLRGAFSFSSPAELSIGALITGLDGANGRFITTYTMGALQGRVADTTMTDPIALENFVLGAVNGRKKPFGGEIAELLVYDRALNDKERRSVEEYLSAKYSLPIKSPEQLARDPKPRSRWSVRLPHLPRTVTWMGNSESGKESWIQHGVFNGCVTPDGTVLQSCTWDEGHKEIGFYKDGHSVMTTDKEGKVVGKGFNGGGAAIAVVENIIFQGTSGMSKPFAGIRRMTMDGEEIPFTNVPKENKGRITFPTSGEWKETRGIAIIGKEIFVTCDAIDEIKVFDLDTGDAKRVIALPAPGRLAADPGGKLWVGLKDKVIQITTDGKPTEQEIPGLVAGGLAVDGKGRLLVADDGERQQVVIFDVSGAKPTEVSALGVRGGVWAGPRPGAIEDDRFMRPRGVGADKDGNLYILDTHRIRSFSPDGKMRWNVECTQFCLCADFDSASDGNDIYTWHHHYQYVPGQPVGRDWKWVGYTEDEKRFPEGINNKNIMLRYLNGGFYRFGASGDTVDISRREENSEIFVPCAQVHLGEGKEKKAPKAAPEKVRYIWTDQNANGLIEADEIQAEKPDAPRSGWGTWQWVDSRGDIWQPQGQTGLRHLPLKGFTPKGAPMYDLADLKLIPRPAEFTEVRRCNYYPETDTMYLCGYTFEHQKQIGAWVGAGPEVIRYENWSQPERKAVSRMVFPEAGMSISSMDFVPSRNLMFAVEVESAVVFAYDTTTGKLLGIVEPDPEIVGNVGWVDYPGGGLHAFERKNGEIVITVEESYLEKQMIYRIAPGFEKTLR